MIVFLALALARNPQWLDRFSRGHDDEIEAFVEEVRRLYPFFPFVGGRLTRSHEWQGYSLPEGSWLLLDLYGTTHDPRLFPSPMNFSAERKLGASAISASSRTAAAGRNRATDVLGKR